ncbi:MAG: AAA family ATPase [Bacteroidia bacterium]|nr:AAA family ATPase [Bacteroidia bacterium]
MTESIYIRNFGGLKEINIPLNRFNILIGKQASGKSVLAKAVYFFKSFFQDLFSDYSLGDKGKPVMSIWENKFVDYFPEESWPEDFQLKYVLGNDFILVKKEGKDQSAKITLSKAFQKVVDLYLEGIEKEISFLQKNGEFTSAGFNLKSELILRLVTENLHPNAYGAFIFIPAGRSFYSILNPSIIPQIYNFDPFIALFGGLYERFLNKPGKFKDTALESIFETKIYEILEARHFRKDNINYLIHSDNRITKISYSSSGQQEVLPLSIILKETMITKTRGDYGMIFIEEPEAHLFPESQKAIVEMIGIVFNNSVSQLSFFITTHSPYILTSFNNLIQAGLSREAIMGDNHALNLLYEKVSQHEILMPGIVNAFALQNGHAYDLIDPETGLINSAILDEVSNEIAIQFDELLELE